MKALVWVGSSLADLKNFPEHARKEAGHWLHVVQSGRDPFDVKPIPGIGAGANEIRIHRRNEYWVVYVAKFGEAVYVLHCFEKKTRTTSKRDMDLARKRYMQVINMRAKK